MKFPFRTCLIPLVVAVLAPSCGDKPELIEKREQQKSEIARLTGEIEQLEGKLKRMPPDMTDELAKAKEQAKQQEEEVERLEAEVSGLDAKKRSLQSDFDAYRAKYQLN